MNACKCYYYFFKFAVVYRHHSISKPKIGQFKHRRRRRRREKLYIYNVQYNFNMITHHRCLMVCSKFYGHAVFYAFEYFNVFDVLFYLEISTHTHIILQTFVKWCDTFVYVLANHVDAVIKGLFLFQRSRWMAVTLAVLQ